MRLGKKLGKMRLGEMRLGKKLDKMRLGKKRLGTCKMRSGKMVR